ncbi:glutaredoxin-C9-like [Corylus avellana]|uniref:glutaredoxin-C9-like n=1 Tax=Corylus avellana TaxID=13451 RepID=UPI00286D0986|nr:glutaredoxin-C9-like [Corylus avellana]
MEVELDEQRSLTDICDNEESSRDSAGSGDSSSVHNGMPTEVELLQNGKAWESIELLKANKAKWCRWVFRKKEPREKVVWPRGLTEKHVKVLFKELGVTPMVCEIDQDPEGREMEKALMKLGCNAPVPIVFIGGHLIGSTNEVMSLHLSGQLMPRLLHP